MTIPPGHDPKRPDPGGVAHHLSSSRANRQFINSPGAGSTPNFLQRPCDPVGVETVSLFPGGIVVPLCGTPQPPATYWQPFGLLGHAHQSNRGFSRVTMLNEPSPDLFYPRIRSDLDFLGSGRIGQGHRPTARPTDPNPRWRGGCGQHLHRAILGQISSAGMKFARWPPAFTELQADEGANGGRIAA